MRRVWRLWAKALGEKIGENNKLKNFFIKVADQGITIS